VNKKLTHSECRQGSGQNEVIFGPENCAIVQCCRELCNYLLF